MGKEACGPFFVKKYEIRNSKSETNSNVRKLRVEILPLRLGSVLKANSGQGLAVAPGGMRVSHPQASLEAATRRGNESQLQQPVRNHYGAAWAGICFCAALSGIKAPFSRLISLT